MNRYFSGCLFLGMFRQPEKFLEAMYSRSISKSTRVGSPCRIIYTAVLVF
ncbi:MAG: hypothetical protein J6V99_00640 [Neisseriaceae bacterium]|nr:hypothetical protein [Neisseriaceae bacterium]